jgi:hypothetical protein
MRKRRPPDMLAHLDRTGSIGSAVADGDDPQEVFREADPLRHGQP